MRTLVMSLVALMAMGSVSFAAQSKPSTHRVPVVVAKAKKNGRANRGKHLGIRRAKKARKNGAGRASIQGKQNAAPQGVRNGVGLGGGTQ